MAKLRYSTDDKATWTDIEAPLPITLPRNTTHIEAIGATVVPPAWNAPDFDFAAGRYAYNGPYSNTLPPEFVFTRTGAGTAQKADGSYVSFATGVPRITDRGLLVEAARTNLLPRSTPGGAGWVNDGIVVSPTPAAPWGPFSAFTITSNGQAFHRSSSSAVAVQSGQPYAVQVIYRRGTSGRARITVRNTAANAESTASGLAGALSASEANAGPMTNITNEALGEQVYKASFIFTPSVTGSITLGVGPDRNIVGETVDGLYAGIEAGAFATSPIITTGVAATRAADAANVPLSLAENGQATILCEVELTDDKTSTSFAIWRAASNTMRLQIDRAITTGRVRAFVIVNDVSVASFEAPNKGGSRKVKTALIKHGDSYAFVVDGISYGTKTAAGLSALSTILLGRLEGGSQYLQDNLRRLQILPYALSEAEAVDRTK